MTTTRDSLLSELSGLYAGDDPAAVAAFATRIGRDAFTDLHRGEWHETGLAKDFVRPDGAARELDLAMLRCAHAHGADLTASVPDIMEQVIRQDSADALAFLRKDLSCTERFDTFFGYRWLIVHCGPAIAPALADEIAGIPDRMMATRQGSETGILPDYCLGTYQPKEFAVLLTASQDVRPAFEAFGMEEVWDGLGQSVRRLIEATASNHGRMWLRSLEPSLTDILARDPLAGFYGLSEGQLHRELQVGGQA